MAHPPSMPEIRIEFALKPCANCSTDILEDGITATDIRQKIHALYEEHPWRQYQCTWALVSYIAYSSSASSASIDGLTADFELSFSGALLIKDSDRAAFDAMAKRIARELAEAYRDSRVTVTVLYATVIEQVYTNPAT